MISGLCRVKRIALTSRSRKIKRNYLDYDPVRERYSEGPEYIHYQFREHPTSANFSPLSERKQREVKKKEPIMSSAQGLPTQFHGVPLEERAIDSKGNRMPWALEYAEGHPNARGQKRHVEEKGPFGKSSRRKGSSRTRTATPAKRDNPTLDGFEQAMRYDAKKAAEAKQEAHTDNNTSLRQAPSHNKEPTQIMVYGYASSRQYAAIERYERCSGGMICEDYDREPPAELQKYPSTYSASQTVHPRPLTKQEKSLAFRYDGGMHWIKLTYDSAEAAARAVESSPIQIYGHWVFAELYNGKGPELDEPIMVTEEDRRQGKPPRRSSQTLSAAFAQQPTTQLRSTSTLPRSFHANAPSQGDVQSTDAAPSLSSSTASSATATGVEYPNLRNRIQSQPDQSALAPNEIAPGIPRYTLRPASEAFPPQPTWAERQIQWLRANGLVPTDFIGHQIPRMENGEFDWNNASWYWRACYWIDTHIGTDICGFKED